MRNGLSGGRTGAVWPAAASAARTS
jgi:hypothetical protein